MVFLLIQHFDLHKIIVSGDSNHYATVYYGFLLYPFGDGYGVCELCEELSNGMRDELDRC